MPIRERAPLWEPRFDLGARERARTWSALFASDRLGRDLAQGLSLATTTLPLSLLLAHLAGAPAWAGIISAAIGSMVCVFLGGTQTALAAGLLGVLALRHRHFPGALIAVAVAVPLVHVTGLPLPTLLQDTAPPFPRLPELTGHGLASLVQSGFALWAALTLVTVINTAALEQLQLDAGVPVRTDPDQELIGHGLASVLLAFLGGVPSSQLVARSALGLRGV